MNEKVKAFLKAVPGINHLLQTNTWRSFRHRIGLTFSDRQNSTFTGFLRLPGQFDALAGPVLDYLLAEGPPDSLTITVIGCSNGAEAYTIASVLKTSFPKLDFKIHAYDIDEEMIEKAKSAVYLPNEIYNNQVITTDFANNTFQKKEHLYTVKEQIAGHVHFDVADALAPDLKSITGSSDIVFAQNFLLHMKPKMAIRAFNNLCLLLNPKAALFIDGMDIGLRTRLTREKDLLPLDYKIKDIHDEAMRARGVGWPYEYWGLEPFSLTQHDWRRRYSTIFLRHDVHVDA